MSSSLLPSGFLLHETVPDSPTDFLDAYVECWGRVRSLAVDTLCHQRIYLDRFVAQFSFDSARELLDWLSIPRLERFAVDYANSHGPGSLDNMLYSLRSLLLFCRYRGYLSEDLSVFLPSRRKRQLAYIPKSLTDSQISELLLSIDRSCPIGARDAAVITTAKAYGVRSIQLRRLLLSDIDWDAEQIHFSPAKGGKALCLPLTVEVGNAIAHYLVNGRPPAVPYAEVFLQVRAPFRPFRLSNSFANIVSRRLRRAGIEPAEGVSHGLHSFRHAFASRLVGRVPFKHIADLLGHRDMASSFVYTKVDLIGLSQTALPWPEEVQP